MHVKWCFNSGKFRHGNRLQKKNEDETKVLTAKNHTHITYRKPVTATALENNTQLQQDQCPNALLTDRYRNFIKIKIEQFMQLAPLHGRNITA